ncbi:hypothetical protein IJ384_02445 [bacterium]|nr:hypothetical protein [bacterium]
MKVSSQENISFRARLLSQWKCSSADKLHSKNISIISLGRDDVAFAEYMLKLIPKLSYIGSACKHVLEDSSITLNSLLNSQNVKLDKKTKIYIAVYDAKPCGLLIGNMPKQSGENGKIVYSSRHNNARNEAELDWLVTWPPQENVGIRGVGKALVGEYLRTIKSDKFRDVYVRSELPEISVAQDFYESLGFEILSDKRKMWESRTTNLPLTRSCDNVTEMMVPMLITRKKIIETLENLVHKMSRRGFIQKEEPIETLVDM